MERNETEIIKAVHLLCQLGEAWYEQEGKFFIFSLDREEPELCRAGDIQLLRDISSTEIKKENITLAALSRELEACYRANTAFSFLLDGLDRSLQEVRRMAIKRANQLCQDEQVRDFVSEQLLTRTLPKEADVEGAINIALALGKEGQQILEIYRHIPLIFIDSAVEDEEKADEFIKKYQSKTENKKLIISLDYQDDPTKTFEYLLEKLMFCHEIIILFCQAPLSWIKERLRFSQVIQVRRDKPMRVTVLSSIPQPSSIKLPKNTTWEILEILTNE